MLVLAGLDTLRRLVAILVDNALKYTNEGGTISIEVGFSGGAAALDVVDTGMGVPQEERQRVFERFYRTANARERADGSGLGLAIARTIVARYRGTIELEPGPAGVGTRVRVRFPIAESREEFHSVA